jgi:hypothetical protein
MVLIANHYNRSLFNCTLYAQFAGDGRCDYEDDNVAPCYDGGDCCESSCVANCNSGTPCTYTCGTWTSWDYCADARFFGPPPAPPDLPSPPARHPLRRHRHRTHM